MIFICLNKTLEEFLNMDIDTRFLNVDWLLFDRYISGRSLKSKNNLLGNGNCGNLSAYMDRVFYYPFYYKEPLHMYLIKDKTFRNMKFLPDSGDYKNVACIWNMKRVPESWEEEKYPRIPKDEMIFGNGNYEEHMKYLRNAFCELASCKEEISYVCMGG